MLFVRLIMNAYHALAASYDRLTNDVDYEATVEFYMEILRREGVQPRTCVDLACGTGTVTKLLAKKDYEVIGVDLSEEMLRSLPEGAGYAQSAPLYLPAAAKTVAATWRGYGRLRLG